MKIKRIGELIWMFIWEIIQTLLGCVVLIFLTDKKNEGLYKGRRVIRFKKGKFFSGTSLGYWILIPDNAKDKTRAHEWGHCMQSRDSGFFYLPIFGIPSLINNLNGRKIYKYMTYEEIQKDYYNRYPEKDADKRAGITWVDGERVL